MGEWADSLDWIHDQLFGGGYDPDYWDEVDSHFRQQMWLRAEDEKQRERIAQLPQCVATNPEDGVTIPGRSDVKLHDGKIIVFFNWNDLPDNYKARFNPDEINTRGNPFLITTPENVSVAEARDDDG